MYMNEQTIVDIEQPEWQNKKQYIYFKIRVNKKKNSWKLSLKSISFSSIFIYFVTQKSKFNHCSVIKVKIIQNIVYCYRKKKITYI